MASGSLENSQGQRRDYRGPGRWRKPRRFCGLTNGISYLWEQMLDVGLVVGGLLL